MLKISSYKVVSLLLVFTALTITVESRDLTLTVLPNDILSYDISYLAQNNDVNGRKSKVGAAAYTSDKAYAIISNVREVESGLTPGGNDVKKISKVVINDATTGYILSDDGIGSITIEGNKITAGKNIDTFKQDEVTSFYSGSTESAITSIDGEEAKISVFDKPGFTGTETKISWDMTTVAPKVNARSVLWENKLLDPVQPYRILYQPDSSIATTKVPGIAWYTPKRDQDPEHNGALNFLIENNFPVDATAILYLNIIDNVMWTVYKSADGTGLASCTFTVVLNKIAINKKTDCTTFDISAYKENAISAAVGINAGKVFAWFYSENATTKNPTLSYCDINTTDKKAENCVSSTQLVETYGAVFEELSFSNTGGLSASFSILDTGATIRRATTLIYNVANNATGVTFDVVEDRSAGTISAFGEKAIVFRGTTYSTYIPVQGQEHVTIYVKKMGDAPVSGKVSITNVAEKKVISTISLSVLKDSKGQYKLISPLPSIKEFKNPLGNMVPISRGYFQGNSLDFSIDNTDYTIFNTYTWPDSATADLGQGTIVVAGTVGGVVVNGANIQSFYCTGKFYDFTFKCALSKSAQTPTDLSALAFTVEATPYDIKDNGIIAVTENGDNSMVHLFNSNDFYKSATITGFKASESNSAYQRVDTLFVVWTVAADNTKVTAHVYTDENLTEGKNVDIDSAFLSKTNAEFCPTGVQSDPSDQEQTFIISQCSGDDTRIFTFGVKKATDSTDLQVTLVSSKVLNSPNLGSGQVNVCALGNEHVLQAAGTNKISTTDNSSDATYSEIDVTGNLGTDKVDLVCIRGSQNFIIKTDSSTQGAHTYAAVIGNKAGNIGNRYHSVNKLATGYTVTAAAWHLEGYTVTLTGADQKFQTVILNGPRIVYTGDKTQGATEVTLNVSALGEAVTKAPTFTVEIDEFSSEVTVKADEKGSKPSKGSKTLDELVKITGPVFDIQLVKGSSQAKIELEGVLTAESDYEPVSTLGLTPPSRIKSDANGKNIGFGTATSGGIDIYLYKDFTHLESKYQLESPPFKLNTDKSIDMVQTGSIQFGAFGVVNGGVNQISWFIKGKSNYFTGVIPEIEFFATEIHVTNHLLSDVVVLAIDGVNKKALSFVMKPDNDGDKWTVEVTNTYVYNDFATGDVLNYSDGNGVILLFTTKIASELKANLITNSNVYDLGTVQRKKNYGISDINCKYLRQAADPSKFEPVCLITQASNTFLDLTLSFTGKQAETKVAITKQKDFNYYSDYQPIYIDFDTEFVTVKGRIYDKTGAATKESMLIYSRKEGGSSDLHWGLKPVDYLEEWKEGDITTPSIPVVISVVKNNKLLSKVRFTQLQKEAPPSTVSNNPRINQNKVRNTFFMDLLGLRVNKKKRNTNSSSNAKGGFNSMNFQQAAIKIEQDEIYDTDAKQINLVFNSGLGSASQTQVPLTNFYETVDPTPSGSSASSGGGSDDNDELLPWWVWVIIGLIIFLVVVGILLYFLTKNKEEEEENDEYVTAEENKQFVNDEE